MCGLNTQQHTHTSQIVFCETTYSSAHIETSLNTLLWNSPIWMVSGGNVFGIYERIILYFGIAYSQIEIINTGTGAKFNINLIIQHMLWTEISHFVTYGFHAAHTHSRHRLHSSLVLELYQFLTKQFCPIGPLSSLPWHTWNKFIKS